MEALTKIVLLNGGGHFVLAILGFVMIIVFMYLIMSNRLSALIALIVVPVVFALISGFGKDLGEMMIQGVTDLAPTGIMLFICHPVFRHYD